MDLNEYQSSAMETAHYPLLVHSVVYPALALAGEAGEVANEVKKAMRDDDGEVHPDRAQKIAYELGDTLWYIAASAHEIGYRLEEIAEMNLAKLRLRKSVRETIG